MNKAFRKLIIIQTECTISIMSMSPPHDFIGDCVFYRPRHLFSALDPFYAVKICTASKLVYVLSRLINFSKNLQYRHSYTNAIIITTYFVWPNQWLTSSRYANGSISPEVFNNIISFCKKNLINFQILYHALYSHLTCFIVSKTRHDMWKESCEITLMICQEEFSFYFPAKTASTFIQICLYRKEGWMLFFHIGRII